MIQFRWVFQLAVLIFSINLTVSEAAAQYYPYRPYGGVYAPYAGPGGYLKGQSEVINAQGQFYNQTEQAQITHQKALQEQINTKKMEFDWKRYEIANTPTWSDKEYNIDMKRLQRIMVNPYDAEITSGQTLNMMTPYIEQMANKGIYGPPIPLNPSVVSRINVKTSGAAGNAGLLKDGADLNFPIVLRGPTQKKLSDEIPAAISMCVNGTLDFAYYQKIRSLVKELTNEHKKKFHEDEIDGGSYLIGKRYIDQLNDAVKVLEQPDAAKYFNGTFKAEGNSVHELVYNMSKNGLKFAAATQGDEPAYMSLHDSMVTFVSRAQPSPGFHVNAPPKQQSGPQIKK